VKMKKSITKVKGVEEHPTYKKRRKAKWIGHILCRNCLLEHVIEAKILFARRRGRRRKQLLDEHKETRRYWKLEEEVLDCSLGRTVFGRVHRPLIRRTK
jgi:hypothetical protein